MELGVPANIFFYGLLNDSSIIQNEFDKYMGKGAWRQVNEAFSELYKGNIGKDRFNLIFKTTQDIIQEFKNIRFKEKNVETVVENNEVNNLNVRNKLTFKQRVAQFLQKNNIFMNLSFVEKYVHQQLDILPPHTQESKVSSNKISSTRDKWYYNPKCVKLSSIQRMSNPQKIEEMKRRMEQKVKSDEKEM